MDQLSTRTTILADDSFLGARHGRIDQMSSIILSKVMIVPLLKICVILCLTMSVMLFVERVYMGVVIILVKLFRKKPEKSYKWEALKDHHNDLELGNEANYPMVLVQIPMYNEKQVYKLSIGAACRLSWPLDRIIIQVLDDSTDSIIKNMVEMECQRWASKGINIKYEIRGNRIGYKAGALKEGMNHHYTKQCEYVAIFDADFQPESDFLYRTIPFLIHNSELALIQARWKFGVRCALKESHYIAQGELPTIILEIPMVINDPVFLKKKSKKMVTVLYRGAGFESCKSCAYFDHVPVNADECLMTRMQEMSFDYHFTVEQEVGSSTYAFFGFNGTAGVWRSAAMDEAGGWKDRTVVEDMDLAVRASLKGWKFLYLGSIEVKNELPSTFRAYRYQQHRWSCGPANLFRKMFMEVIKNKRVSLWKKVHVIYSFFLVRKIIAHVVTFLFYCIVLPATVLVPEVQVPKWGSVYIPCIITILNSVGTPRSLHLVAFWIVFENVMSLHRTKSTFIGLLETKSFNEWVVTEKLGDAGIKALKKPHFCFGGRFHMLEIIIGLFLVFCGFYDFTFGRNLYFLYLFVQGFTFFVVGFGYVGTTLVSRS